MAPYGCIKTFANKIEGFVGRPDFRAKEAQSSSQWPKMAQKAQDDLDGEWRAISVSHIIYDIVMLLETFIFTKSETLEIKI